MRKVIRSLPKRFISKVTVIVKNKDLYAIKIEKVARSLRTYELSLPYTKKNKFLTLNTVKKETSNQANDDTLKDEKFACFVKKFKKFFQDNKRSSKKYKGISSKYRKDKEIRVTVEMPRKCLNQLGVMSAKVLDMLEPSTQVIRKP